VLSALRRIEARGAIESAHKIKQMCGQVCRFAVASGVADRDITVDLRGKFVFPSVRTGARSMSENTINAALRGMGCSKDVMTGHGFRAMARTIMDEVLGERVDLIKHQLAHAVRDANGRAYNQTAHLPARKEMMQRWADYLDKLRRDAEVVPLRQPS
jgi:integrase